jgi:hypothetical protein
MASTFIRDTAERVVSTAAQAAIAVIGAGELGLFEVNWENVGSVAGLAAVLTVLKALAAGWTVPNGTASFVPEVVAGPKSPSGL